MLPDKQHPLVIVNLDFMIMVLLSVHLVLILAPLVLLVQRHAVLALTQIIEEASQGVLVMLDFMMMELIV